jgi:predicted phosphodiesterase
MSDGPILVISDTHFGFETESAARFKRFLMYLTNSVQSGRLIVKTSNEQSDEVAKTVLSEESLEAPQKIILLGDILDLWISRDSNTLRPYQESFNIFNSLIALNVEIVYLFGNHDCIMWEYKGKHSLPGGAFFTVYRFGYPNKKGSDGRWKGEKIGERTYFFLHGHQFDLFFRHESVLLFGNFMGFS